MKPSHVEGVGHLSSAEGQGIVLLEDQNLYTYSPESPAVAESDLSRPLDAKLAFPHENVVFKGELPTANLRVDASGRLDMQPSYQLHMTPYAPSSHGAASSGRGAIRPGGAVDLFDRQHVGLLINYTLVGFFEGSVAGLARPFLRNYLGYSNTQMNAALSIFNAPRLFKCVGGFMSDCVPINRQRRKPYMLIGWAILMVFMAIIALMNEPEPQRRGGIVVNANADDQGPRYVLLVLFGLFGALMITAVACEGLMVEYAHREGIYERGRTTSWCMGLRFFAEGVASMATAFALNSEEFGGNFDSAVPLRVIFAGYALLSALGIAFSKYFIYEEPTPVTSQRLVTQCRRIWGILQKRMVSQVTVLGFFLNVGVPYKIYEADQIFKKWLGANALVANVPVAIVSEGKAVAAALFLVLLLNSSWRAILVWSVVTSLTAMVPVEVLMVYDVYRSLALSLVQSVIVAIPDGLLAIMYRLVVIEVAEPGYEAVSYGIITLVYNLAFTVTSMVKNLAATQWSPDVVDVARDTTAVRQHVMNELLFKYGLRVAMAVLVWGLLPRQKRHLYVPVNLLSRLCWR